MQQNILTKGFEQIQTPKLPKRALRIVTSIAKRHRHISNNQGLSPKQLELAGALLRMKLYQAFGPASKDLYDIALTELREQLEGRNYFSGPTLIATKEL